MTKVLYHSYGIIFNKRKDKILLVKSRDLNLWTLPGGMEETGETPEETAVREVFEETGYRTKIIKKLAEYTHKAQKGRKDYLFETPIVSGKKTLSNESSEISFHPISNLPRNANPHLLDWIKNLKPGQLIKKEIPGISKAKIIYLMIIHPVYGTRYLGARTRQFMFGHQ